MTYEDINREFESCMLRLEALRLEMEATALANECLLDGLRKTVALERTEPRAEKA